jgi:predicted ester cyclase
MGKAASGQFVTPTWIEIFRMESGKAVEVNVDSSGSLKGWDAFRQYIGVFKAASPDSKLNVTTLIDGGDVVAMEGTFTGTFTNPLPTPQGELQPTGKSFELPFVEVNEGQGGRIISHRVTTTR